MIDVVLDFQNALVHPTGVGDHHDQDPQPGQADNFDVTHGGPAKRGVLHHGELFGQLREKSNRAFHRIIEIRRLG